MWFEELMGFKEESPENVRENISLEGGRLISKVNGKSYQYGSLEIPTLQELKEKAPKPENFRDKLLLSEIIADVQELHCLPENKHALFQAASQFNLLEMVNPSITPEQGIDRYENDFTQGPACAIACGAGTIYRNYFAPVNGKTGQSKENQIDCLELIGKEFDNQELKLWEMKNGYTLVNQEGLLHLNAKLSQLNETEREQIKGKLKIGIQWDTEVTISNNEQIVSQAYCSALPVAYSSVESIYWEKFARIILETTYEAILYTALINYQKTNCNKVYLTLVGGGVFGNETYWITESIAKALKKFRNTPLDVKIVSYKYSNTEVQKMMLAFS